MKTPGGEERASHDLERFKEAQEGEFEVAVAELRAGRKQSHWIWYVFPQLRGLGSSPYAVRFGLDGVPEARVYLHDGVLRARYLEALRVVHDQVVGHHVRLERLMGSHIDALKLVSSLTLFEHAAGRLQAVEGGDTAAELCEIGRLAGEVLAAADTQGFARCEFTRRAIAPQA
jgi:uncharacterized protein (DUF1810 family)